MSRITDYVLDQESNGELEYSESKAIYEQSNAIIKGNDRKSPQDALSLSKEEKQYMKTEQFAQEWDNFIRKGFF